MNIRKNLYTLSDQQLQDLKDALNAAKADGSYDDFIVRHHHAMMMVTLMPGEVGDATFRNVAHRGPAFLPWHRYFIRELEKVLQTKKANVTLPYWDWVADAANPSAAALWNTNAAQRIYVGGDGTGPGGVVNTGPFAGWTALIEDVGGNLVPRPGGIIRALGVASGNPSFPTAAQVTDAIQNLAAYDTSPWRTTSAGSFRNRLEGWLRIGSTETGSQLHNRVHLWVGGDMGPGTSPNDPVFFLHHCNIDRLWAQWQHAHPGSAYEPASGGPPGHNLNDVMQSLTTVGATPSASLDYRRSMGFIYDTDPPLVELPQPVVNFQDVPSMETTWRAAVFHVRAGSTIHLEIVPGSGPAAPYSTTALGTSLTHVPPVDSAPFDKVRVWFAFTGAASPGAAADGSVQVRCVETNEVFNVTLKANTVERPTTGVVFVLDKSGSMNDQAGTGSTRMQLLHEAASRCVELTRDGSGAGVVSFDQDAHPGQPLQPFTAASSHRTNVLGAITGLTAGGATSIGDGVELGRQTLTAGAAPFAGTALVVLTDGLENQPKWLDQVMGSIDNRTFAIGLGTAQQVSTTALSKIAHNTNGYLLLTGPLTPDTDSYFLLSKYFQQILVTATNENIVTDPSGFIAAGQRVGLPFELAETDIDATVVLFVDAPVVELALQTPDGKLLGEADLAALGAQVTHGTNMTFARVALPLPVGAVAGAHAGSWTAQLTVDRSRWKRELTQRKRAARDDRTRLNELSRLEAHGARYSVSVISWSNVRLAARVTQPSFEPGAKLALTARLTEYGLPVEGRARVEVDVVRPDGVPFTVHLREIGEGVFEGVADAGLEGVWRLRFRAWGHTFSGRPFTREQLASAAVVVGGDHPPNRPPDRSEDGGAVLQLLGCLLGDDGFRRWLDKKGVDAKRVEECLARARRGADGKQLDLLG